FEEHSAVRDEHGVVWTAQLRTGSGLVMIGPGMAEFGSRAVDGGDGATCRIHVLVDDLESHYQRAVAEGAVIHTKPMAQFGDERIYIAIDWGGQQWIFAQPLTG